MTPLQLAQQGVSRDAAERTDRAAVCALLRGTHKYAYFLSHYQRNGGAQMQSLKEFLEKRGLTCWLDKNETPNLEGMMQGIADSAVFLLYLTRGVLKRDWCRVELRRALELGKPILLLAETEDNRLFYSDDDPKNPCRAAASIDEFKKEDESQEFLPVFNKCVAVTAQFHGVKAYQDTMVDLVVDSERHAFVVPGAWGVKAN